jgi:hypothetical protein
MSDRSPYACGYEVLGDGTAKPRPVPEAIRSLADANQRQDAEAAWEAASRLFRLIDQWRGWFEHLRTTGDADPGFAIRLWWAVKTCVRTLRALGLSDRPEIEIFRLFPEPPSGDLNPYDGYDLILISAFDSESEIPTAGERLIVVAAVKDLFRFRVFDRDGKMVVDVVVDAGETTQTDQAEWVRGVGQQLKGLLPPHELTEEEKTWVILLVASIVHRTPIIPWQNDKVWFEQSIMRLWNLTPVQGSLSSLLRSLESAPGVVVRRPAEWRQLLSAQHYRREPTRTIAAETAEGAPGPAASATSTTDVTVVELNDSTLRKDSPRGTAVILGKSGGRPIVCGKSKAPLTLARYNIVKALIDAGDDGLTGDELAERSGHGGAVNVLKSLAKSDPDWRSVIQLPGKPGGRYRLRLTDPDGP